MDLIARRSERTEHVILHGPIGPADARRLSEYLRGLLSEPVDEVWVDLARVSSVEVATLSALVSFHRQMTEHDRRLVLCGVGDRVAAVLEESCLDRILMVANEDTESLREEVGLSGKVGLGEEVA